MPWCSRAWAWGVVEAGVPASTRGRGSALTVHKAQGSQWDEVVLFDTQTRRAIPVGYGVMPMSLVTRALYGAAALMILLPPNVFPGAGLIDWQVLQRGTWSIDVLILGRGCPNVAMPP